MDCEAKHLLQPRILEWNASGSLVVKKNKKSGMKKANTRNLWKKQVQQWRDEDEAARMAMVAAKREALMDRLGQKRTAGHTKGAARREPYPLRRQADAVHAAETVAQWDECWRQEVVFLPPIFQATARSKMTTMNLTSPRHLDTASAANDRESEVLGIHTLPDIPVLTHDDAASPVVVGQAAARSADW